MTTVVSFVSQKGGVGKTTSAVNLATAFAIGGYKVLLIDLDPQGSVRFSMGVKKTTTKGGTKELFLNPEIPFSDLIQQTEIHGDLEFLFSNINKISEEKAIEKVASDNMFLENRIREGGMEYDMIVIDAPASTNNLAINAMVASNLVILPLQCEALSIRSLKRFMISFQELQANMPHKQLRLAGVLLTMYDKSVIVHRKVTHQIYKALSDAVFKTIIPRHDSILDASALGKSVITHKLNSVGATAYIRFMNELIDKFGIR